MSVDVNILNAINNVYSAGSDVRDNILKGVPFETAVSSVCFSKTITKPIEGISTAALISLVALDLPMGITAGVLVFGGLGLYNAHSMLESALQDLYISQSDNVEEVSLMIQDMLNSPNVILFYTISKTTNESTVSLIGEREDSLLDLQNKIVTVFNYMELFKKMDMELPVSLLNMICTETTTYTIKSGDTISAICTKYGISLEALLELNPWLSERFSSDGKFALIKPGEKLVMPNGLIINNNETAYTDLFRQAQSIPAVIHDPLIVDLDSDGIETTTLENGVYFDNESDGFAEKTSWVGKDDDSFYDIGGGDDIFIFNLGDGQDTIYNREGNDTIKFGEGITKENINFKRGSDNELLITFTGANDSVKIRSFFSNNGRSVEKFDFKDGRTMTDQEVADIVMKS